MQNPEVQKAFSESIAEASFRSAIIEENRTDAPALRATFGSFFWGPPAVRGDPKSPRQSGAKEET
jgi:hypothetical protein